MFPTTSVIRNDERTLAWGAFALLFLLMVSHAMLETARDTLFLSSIPASRLPVVYLLVAGASLAVLQLQKMLQDRLPRKLSMSLYLAVSSVITGGLWVALPSLGDPGLYVLYVWSSVMITLILLQFWLTLGRLLTVQQAKRLYAFVGTGSVAGAITGFAVAGGVASNLGAELLLPAAAGVLLFTAVLPPLLGRDIDAERDERVDATTERAKLLFLPYVWKVAALIIVGTITVTVADYLFKSSIAASVPAEQLGAWFAAIYLVLNVAALVVQLLLTARLVRFLGVTRSASILPAALSIGAIGTMLGFGLPAALALKGADGTLRHTLNHTARELLFVPMSERVRARVKGMIDVVGQRGGQALASVAILGMVAMGLDNRVLGVLLLALTGVWAGIALMLREPYLAVFRRTLNQLATGRRLDFPDLDVASLESLIEALNNSDEHMVVAALEILEREGKAKLVPALLLYHPSTLVVTSALAVFTRAGRRDFLQIADQLQGNANPTVHAALVRAKMAIEPDEAYLRRMLDSHCRATRTTAVVFLHAMGASTEEEAAQTLEFHRNHDNRVTAELAIARAAPLANTALIRQILVELLDSDVIEVATEAAEAMGQIGAAEFLPVIVPKLANRDLKETILHVLPPMGPTALECLDMILCDCTQGVKARREIPEAIGRFPPLDATKVLLGRLTTTDGMVEYRIIRTLERLQQAHPSLAEVPEGWGPDSKGREQVDRAIDRTLTQLYEFIDKRGILVRGAQKVPERETAAHGFLVRLLRDKQRHAEERLVRLIGLKHPAEDFGSIWRGLNSKAARVQASSQELLDNLMVAPLRRPVEVLFSDGSDAERLAAGKAYFTPAPHDYDAVLSQLVDSDSTGLRALAVAQVGELRLTHFQPQLERLPEQSGGLLGDVLGQTLALLADPRLQEVRP